MISSMRRKMKSRGGFTLVELLVVIVILGILAAIGIQQFGAVQTNAANRAHESNIRLLRSAGQMWYMANSDETIPTDGLDLTEATLEAYLESWPEVPSRANILEADPGDDGQEYTVQIISDEADNISVVVGVNGTPADSENDV